MISPSEQRITKVIVQRGTLVCELLNCAGAAAVHC